MENTIQYSIEPVWKNIDPIRRQTREFLAKNKASETQIDAIIMSLSELLENAVKYGTYNNDHSLIFSTISLSRHNITVEVKSPISDKDDVNFARLDKTIQWIRGFQNPFQAYIEKLKEISIKSLTDRESGLGITRIAYEGQSIVDFYLGDDNTISVSAVYLL